MRLSESTYRSRFIRSIQTKSELISTGPTPPSHFYYALTGHPDHLLRESELVQNMGQHIITWFGKVDEMNILFVLVIVVIKHFEIGLVDIDLYIDFTVFRVFEQYFINNSL